MHECTHYISFYPGIYDGSVKSFILVIIQCNAPDIRGPTQRYKCSVFVLPISQFLLVVVANNFVVVEGICLSSSRSNANRHHFIIHICWYTYYPHSHSSSWRSRERCIISPIAGHEGTTFACLHDIMFISFNITII